MPTLKRNKLLSDLERNRLEKRKSLDPHTRNTNDVRVKRKLLAWMKELDDISVILKHLPKDQWNNLSSSINEDQIAILFKLSEKLMDLRDFYGIEGNQSDRTTWKVTKDGYDERGFPRPASSPRKPTDRDIKQSWIVAQHELALKKHRTGDRIIIVDREISKSEKVLPLERHQYVIQDQDPAVMMGFMAQHRDSGATFSGYTPEMFAAMDEVAAIIKEEPKNL